MEIGFQEVTSKASEKVFGFPATSKSLRPVHIAHGLFSYSLGYTKDNEKLRELVDKPSDNPASDLDESIKNRFNINNRTDDEKRLDQARLFMRKVLDNDDSVYSDKKFNAPTCSSDWFVNNAHISHTLSAEDYAPFLYRAVKKSEDLNKKLKSNLENRSDGISLLFRPLLMDDEEERTDKDEWSSPELGETYKNGVGEVIESGFDNLGSYIGDRSKDEKFLRDLRWLVRYSTFSMHLYMINRNIEINEDIDKSDKTPILLNYSNSEAVKEASIETINKGLSQVEEATKKGVESLLKQKGAKDFDKEEFLRLLNNQEILDLGNKSEKKKENITESFKQLYKAHENKEDFQTLVDSVNDAIHFESQFNTYTPRGTIGTFSWRIGLVKPRGNRSNKRYYEPDIELLEAIVLSVLNPSDRMPIAKLCERLRKRYGIIVGGTTKDIEHLNEWGIQIGSTSSRKDPLKNQNFEAFKDILVDLGYAKEYADGVTIVSTNGGNLRNE